MIIARYKCMFEILYNKAIERENMAIYPCIGKNWIDCIDIYGNIAYFYYNTDKDSSTHVVKIILA
jgi:hypothetical protein